ncbi:hypothetical protein [Paraburkholderia hospita]|uniref:Uncharacterized protein n=1 Tax=Paraburkholderia hospita TaxID=169430 RepID=A0AAJ4VXX3_9BURK|nr:hypothetical protein [Paraburkholderia hospita]AUT76386.1 hypothetical protein C2L64_50020 [Paraburkholderia hospita]AXF06169.1 hypothetical protein CUJ88_48840 [Paraburkholderia hospita]OUL97821.1 hypothetical protein CA603_00580 [Paraburkholderia hospita]SEI27208.1 hypothetical protein SAMN05192544_108330 [Paraburkholderia hospita]
MTTIFDDEARAEMLCYLVAGELVAMARTGDWLRTDHLVELSLVWMHANGAQPEWPDRISIVRMAVDLAPDILATFELRTEKALASLFTDGGRLDYRVPLVGEIHDRCAERLQRH